MGTLAILDREAGDITIGWDKNNPDEIENAQATFDDMRAKGHMAYRVDKEGGKGADRQVRPEGGTDRALTTAYRGVGHAVFNNRLGHVRRDRADLQHDRLVRVDDESDLAHVHRQLNREAALRLRD